MVLAHGVARDGWHRHRDLLLPRTDQERRDQLLHLVAAAINEQCFQYKECNYPPPGYPDWVASGKVVFNVEYKLSTGKFCPQANTWTFNSILKDTNLYDTPWTPCR
jgi:hypothetical protein